MQDQGSKFETFANKTLDASLRWEVRAVKLLELNYSILCLFCFQFSCNVLVNPQDIQWLRSITTLPIIIKGILTSEDGKFKIL